MDPRDSEIRYVGQTIQNIDDRLSEHCRNIYRDDYRARWVRLLKRLGLKPLIQSVQQVSEISADAAEIFWISHFFERGCKLTNSTEGGCGTRGRVYTPETRKKISEANKRWQKDRPNVMLGKTHTPEVRKIISDTHKKRYADNPDLLKRIGDQHRGKIISQEHRKIVSDAGKRRWATWKAEGCPGKDEMVAKLQEGFREARAKGIVYTAEFREGVSKRFKGKVWDQGRKSKLSVSLTKLYADRRSRGLPLINVRPGRKIGRPRSKQRKSRDFLEALTRSYLKHALTRRT